MNKNPLSVLWTGKCTIYEYQSVTHPNTFQTTKKKVAIVVDEPCRLSFNSEQATDIQSGAAVVSQSITLFIRPDLTIKAGSFMEITQNGVTTQYKGSGKPSIYSNHQEIKLQLYEDKA